MKKQCMTAAVAAMLLGAVTLSSTALAADGDTDLQVTYSQPSSYALTIPKKVDLNVDGGSVTVTAGDVNVAPGHTFRVAIDNNAKNSFSADANGAVVSLDLQGAKDAAVFVTSAVTMNGGALTSNDLTVISVPGGDGVTARSQQINFGALQPTAPDAVIRAGSYSGTMTFVAGVTAD